MRVKAYSLKKIIIFFTQSLALKGFAQFYDMKRSILLLCLFGLLFLITDAGATTINSSPLNFGSLDTLKGDVPEIIVIIPHRATRNRKKDGMDCGCQNCFGICLAIVIDIFHPLMEPNAALVSLGKSGMWRLYYTNPVPVGETMVYVDEDIFIQKEMGKRTEALEQKISKGQYPLSREEGIIEVRGQPLKYFAYIDVLINTL